MAASRTKTTIALTLILAPIISLAGVPSPKEISADDPPSQACVEMDLMPGATSLYEWFQSSFGSGDIALKRRQECFDRIADPERAGSSQSNFILNLAGDDKLNEAIFKSASLRRSLFHDPDLRPSLAQEDLRDYRKVIAHGPSLRFLYSEPSGVREGYSIGRHTIRVLEVFEAQKTHYRLAEIAVPGVRDIANLMRHALALHDIGKSIAVRSGDKDREEKFSVPIAARMLETEGFNAHEIKLASILIREHQSIGGYLQGKWSIGKAEESVRSAASEMNVPAFAMFRLFEMVFISDAGSYPYLRGKVFKEDGSGKLIPKGKKYEELAAVFATAIDP